MPAEQVLSLKKAVDAGIPLDPYPYLKEGQRVRLVRGPLTGVEGILEQKSGQHHLVLSVDLRPPAPKHGFDDRGRRWKSGVQINDVDSEGVAS